MKKIIAPLFVFLVVACLQISPARAQTFLFTYQAVVKDGGVPANGQYDFEFRIFDAPAGGNQVGGVVAVGNLPISNGLLNMSIGFGGVFTGPDRYLEVRMRQTGSANFVTLAPRTLVTSAPYSLRSLSAQTADNSLSLGGIAANQFLTTSAANTGFIQNTTSPQTSSNFNISGTGTANILNAATQFNLGGNRLLSAVNNNTFAGFGTGNAISTGNFNTFVGRGAGIQATTGDSNSFLGNLAGERNSTGAVNSFFGDSAGRFTTTGCCNAFFGESTGATNTTGTRNTLLGTEADVLSSNLTNANAIGYRAAVGASNSLVLGSISGINLANADTNVGIGTTTPSERLTVVGNAVIAGRIGIGTSVFTPLKELHVRGAGDQEIMIESSDSNGLKWSLQASDGGAGGRFEIINRTDNVNVFTVLRAGSIGIGTTTPLATLDVRGHIATFYSFGGNSIICKNDLNEISTCSSSIRYKTNINPYTPGLNLVRRLRPVSFNWKSNNQADFGLVAEEVEAVEPLLTTTNDKGEIEGVKYDRVGVVLVNAVKEQQAQIENQQREINEQKERLAAQDKLLKKQQVEIEALKQIVCAQNKTAEICKAGM